MLYLSHGRRRGRRRVATMSVVAGILATTTALALGHAGYAAAPIVVPCSAGGAGLVAAIDTANGSGGGTIKLAGGCTYQLTSANNTSPIFGANGLPVVTTRIVVEGKGATIAANGTNFRIFQVNAPNGDLTLDHVTLTGGVSLGNNNPGPSGAGGALFNNGATVTLDHSVVTGNTAQAGGGLASNGTLTLDHTLVTNNVALSQGGGGIVNRGGMLTLNHSQVTYNSGPGGGGIASGPGNISGTGSTIVLDHSQVAHNTATGGPEGGGGGIANGGVLVGDHSDVSDNTAPGGFGAGILNHGSSATLDHSTVTGNTAPDDGDGNQGYGGGIANVRFGDEAPVPQFTLTHSDVKGNSASGDGGGIINLGGTVTLDKTDVSGNTPDNCAPTGTVPGCTG